MSGRLLTKMWDGEERRSMADEEQRDLIKSAAKDAIKEWLDDQFAKFGKWSMAALASAALAGLVYFILNVSGWHR